MYKKKLLSSIALGFTLVLMVIIPAWAKTVKTEFYGTTYPTGVIDLGEWFYAGNMEIWHGMIATFDIETTDLRFTGEDLTVTLNSNFKIDPYYGQEWGKWELVNDMCTWSGSWVGYHEKETDMIYLKAVGQGDCGDQIIQVRWHAERYALSEDPSFAITGYLIEH